MSDALRKTKQWLDSVGIAGVDVKLSDGDPGEPMVTSGDDWSRHAVGRKLMVELAGRSFDGWTAVGLSAIGTRVTLWVC